MPICHPHSLVRFHSNRSVPSKRIIQNIEAGLRGVVAGLIDEAHVLSLDEDAATMVRDLDDRLCCPRDLGAPAAAAIRRLAALYTK